MIKALIEIGKSVEDLYPLPLVEKPYPSKKGKNEPKVLVINLSSNGTLKLSNVELYDYEPEESLTKYFFRRPLSSQGPAASLSFKFPEKESALRQRLGILKILGYEADEKCIASSITSKVELFKKEGKIQKGTPLLVVLKIDNKWPSENERLRRNFIDRYLETLGSYKKKPIWKTTGICHGCGKETTVYGGVGNLLKFYTVDKYGYAPELNPKIAWKQYALCEECIFNLERGDRAVADFLTWQFYGKNFWILPVATKNLRRVLDSFKELHAEYGGITHKEGFEDLEDWLLYEASTLEDAISYHFLFVKKDNQALRIRLHIEEVLPSVLSQYISVKKELQDRFNDFIFNAITTKSKIKFNFFSSPTLKATSQKPGFSEEDFYMLVDRVFRRSPIDESYLIKKAMSRITKDLAESGEKGVLPINAVIETLLSLEFLLEWRILKRKIGGAIMTDLPFEEFFSGHGDFFNHPAKRGLVLLGVLVQNFLNYQYSQRGSTPFLKVLKNLRLDEDDVKKVYVSLQNKMNEYEIGHWWPELREGISLNFIEAGENWPLTPEEIGFYIAIGMALHRHPIFKAESHE